MAEGSQLTVQLLREDLQLSREAILRDFSAELKETTTSFQGLRHELGEEINQLRQDHAQVTT